MFLSLIDKPQALRVPPVLLFAAAALVVAAVTWNLSSSPTVPHFSAPQTISVLPKTVSYRMSGEFQLNSLPVDGQLQPVTLQKPMEIMKYQVSEQQYSQCVSDGACPVDASANRPVTGISFLDAEKYGFWLSHKTGDNWRLPTDQEWAALAGSRYADDAVGSAAGAADPSRRWLDRYANESGKAGVPDPVIHASGFFGANENGLMDLSGNVWEWTSACYSRSTISDDGQVASAIANCGVRVVEGRHRAYMTDFIRDAKTGGCAIGAPPGNLGKRLIREEPGFLSRQWLRRFFMEDTS
jgi:formylglycine-generating enzyme required for sulfatase activity